MQNSKASIDQQVLTINGIANSTYKDISCAGANGNQDQIIASVTVNGSNIILTQDINLSGETLGAIEFVSAEPDSIVLKGTGGVGRQEVSTITFRVKGKQSNLLAQQEVNFSASTNVGGLEVSPKTAVTNSQGEVSTKVISGTVPTPVRITASAATTNDAGENVEIISQSDLLSVNTGLADQNSISLSAAVLNPESNSINGVTTEITAWLASGASYWAFYETQEVTPGNFTEVLVASNRDSVNDFRTPINRDSSQTYSLFFGDTALQTLPSGTSVTVTSDVGELVGQTSFTIGNTTGTNKAISQQNLSDSITISQARNDGTFGGQSISFSLKNTLGEDEPSTTANLVIEITSPANVVTSRLITITLR